MLRNPISRRTVLAGAVAAISARTLTACSGARVAPLRSPRGFDRPLTIPALDLGRVDGDGVRTFELVAQAGTSDFGGSTRTATWGFNGDHLGPTLRAREGEVVRVVVSNDLDETTSVHWHGMHLPAKYDGGPHQPILPGSTWEPTWRIQQEAATLWYHPHPHGSTQEHVYRGLAGLFILDPPDGADPGLPSDYGVDDIPVVIQDKKINDDGELVFDDGGNEIGLMGNTVLTNGVHGAYVEVSSTLTRLRLLNGSTARSYRLELSDGRAFHLVGTDGGLVEEPVPLRALPLSPGERAEIVVAMKAGEKIQLRSTGADLGAVVALGPFGGEDEVDILELRAASELHSNGALPARLNAMEVLSASRATHTRQFVLEGREINGVEMDMDRIDATVDLGAIEIWEVRSKNLFPHNFHIHDVQFQILDIDGQAPPAHLRGRKDVVYLEPNRTYRLIMSFEDYADPIWPYMYHCHLLLHEDDGMMGQLLVLEPGDSPSDTIGSGDHEH